MFEKLPSGLAGPIARHEVRFTLRALHSRFREAGSRSLFGIGMVALLLPFGNLGTGVKSASTTTRASISAPSSATTAELPTLTPSAFIGGNPLQAMEPFTTCCQVRIVGPNVVPANTVCTWTPDINGVSGPPYAGTIRWSIDGQLVSPVWNYTGTTPSSNFTLLLEVWDPNDVFLDSVHLVVQVSPWGSC